jgi:hypothetical protein
MQIIVWAGECDIYAILSVAPHGSAKASIDDLMYDLKMDFGEGAEVVHVDGRYEIRTDRVLY